jgi:hypothetical protein
MKSISPDPLGRQLHQAVTAILSLSKRDLPRAIRKARTYLAWVRKFKPGDEGAEEQRLAAIFTLNKLIAVLEARSPRRPR